MDNSWIEKGKIPFTLNKEQYQKLWDSHPEERDDIMGSNASKLFSLKS